jgi:thiol-disulfide isomerase/thioredoxin
MCVFEFCSIASLLNLYRCGPCRMVAPIFEKMSTDNPEVEFVKVDVDEADEVAGGM